jgi:YhcH/YjgK/YiaL family protein
MVLDWLTNAHRYEQLAAGMAEGFRFLRETDLRTAPVGKIEIAGPRAFALVQDYSTKPVEQGFWESHRKHIDIQYVVSGVERIGVAPVETLRVTDPFDEGRDLIKYAGDGDWITVREGQFTVFFPQDGHMPGVQAGDAVPVRKVVVKVAI